MGVCVSKPNKRVKSKAKSFYKSCRVPRKIAPSSPFAPLAQYTDEEIYESESSVQEFAFANVQNDEPIASPRFQVQNLNFLPQTRQAHNLAYSNKVLQEEQWFDSLSVLDSDTDEDYISTTGDINTSLDTHSEGNSCFAEYGCNRINLSKTDDKKEHDYVHLTNDRQDSDLSSSTKADDRVFTRNKIDFQEGSMRRRDPTVTSVAMKGERHDGDIPTELCSSKRYLHKPRAGVLIPRSMDEKPAQGCWCPSSGSAFKLFLSESLSARTMLSVLP